MIQRQKIPCCSQNGITCQTGQYHTERKEVRAIAQTVAGSFCLFILHIPDSLILAHTLSHRVVTTVQDAMMKIRFESSYWPTYPMIHHCSAQLLEKWMQALQMDFQYVSENLTALPKGWGRVWQSHHIALGPAESSVSLCWAGGVEEDAEQLWAEVIGGFVWGTLCFHSTLSSECTATHLWHLSFSSSSTLSPLCCRYSCFTSMCPPTFFVLSFHASLFSLCVSESSYLLPTLPYDSKFSPDLFFPSCCGWGRNQATSLTLSAISGDYCNTVRIHLCFHFLYTVFFFFSLSFLSLAVFFLCFHLWTGCYRLHHTS